MTDKIKFFLFMALVAVIVVVIYKMKSYREKIENQQIEIQIKDKQLENLGEVIYVKTIQQKIHHTSDYAERAEWLRLIEEERANNS